MALGGANASAHKEDVATSGQWQPVQRLADSVAATIAPLRPNIVVVQADDLSSNLLPYMPEVQRLRREGTSFKRYIVDDSQCCPSRASGLTGRYVHNTGVWTNEWPDGGFSEFHFSGQETDTFAVRLHDAGYRTALMGKYLNGYKPTATMGGDGPFVPPGWSTWVAAGLAYDEYNYALNINGRIKRFGDAPADYLTDVLARKSVHFVASAARDQAPFFLEVNPFSPHPPAVPAPRHANDFPGLVAPQGPAFNRLPINPPAWLARTPAFTANEVARLDGAFRQRVRSVQSIDELVGRLRRTLNRTGIARNTVFIFTSDNGFHLGEHRLIRGKLTDFATDTDVPFIAAGGGIPAGGSVGVPVQNVDKAPTFLDLAGVPSPQRSMDGRSLVPLWQGHVPGKWRHAALVEHHVEALGRKDPDFQPGPVIPKYTSMSGAFTYTRYSDGSTAFYDNKRDPHQLNNLADQLSRAQRVILKRALREMATCVGARECTDAARFPRLGPVR